MRAFNVLSMEATLPFAGYREPARTRAFYRNLTDRLREIPGVKAVAITTDLPLKPDGERRAFTPDEQPNGAGGQSSIAVTWTHGDYFTTFGVPLIKGRNFAPEEQVENRLVMIVSKGLADRYWPGQDPDRQAHQVGPAGVHRAVADRDRRRRRCRSTARWAASRSSTRMCPFRKCPMARSRRRSAGCSGAW